MHRTVSPKDDYSLLATSNLKATTGNRNQPQALLEVKGSCLLRFRRHAGLQLEKTRILTLLGFLLLLSSFQPWHVVEKRTERRMKPIRNPCLLFEVSRLTGLKQCSGQLLFFNSWQEVEG